MLQRQLESAVLQPDDLGGPSTRRQDAGHKRELGLIDRDPGPSLEINPSLKFTEVELSAGSYTHSYDYETLEPVISAAGRGGHDLSWDFTAFHDGTVTGGKRMHALISVPAASGAVHARLSFSADLLVERRFRRPATLPKNETGQVIELVPAATPA